MDEFTLDPENWDELRQLGHKMLDDMFDYIQNVRDRPVWIPPPKELKEKLEQPFPVKPQPREEIYEEFKETVLPYPPGNIHPRFWGWVNGTGSAFGMLAEMASAAMNSNTGGREHMPKYVEEIVISWSKELMGYPHEASGVLTSGCSESNLIALTVARNFKLGPEARRKGMISSKPLVFYASKSTHSSIQKAIEILGVGSENYRTIETNDQMEIDVEKLQEAIIKDQEEGNIPCAVIANVGTVDTGAVDDLRSIRKICDEYNLWFHIDGAFGSIVKISEKYKDLVDGVELSDSLAFDFHKWMYVPYTVACVLVKFERLHRESFSLRPSYLTEVQRGLGSGGRWPTEYGIQLSRPFYALKVWFMLKENGKEKYSKLVTQNMEQARYLKRKVEQEEFLEMLAPVKLNVVCFRFNPGNMSENQLKDVNTEIVMQLHESGEAAPSYTSVNGNFAIRLAITNHRSKISDFDFLVERVIHRGRIITESMS